MGNTARARRRGLNQQMHTMLVRVHALQRTTSQARHRQRLLYVLMIPAMVMIFNNAVFGVALPTVRDQYGLSADTAAWLVTAYSLPFMMFMPLYGRLGDSLGKRNLILAGLVVFIIGTLITILAEPLPLLLLGRTIQGVGVAGIAPLSIAIISERFSSSERGKALGTWNSVGPMVGIAGPLLAGFLIDRYVWRTIFLPVFFVALIAMVAVWVMIPSLRSIKFGALRTFDWIGVMLLSTSVSFFVFFVSSRPITGVEPLQDWRLLAVALVAGALFVRRERRQPNPYISLALFGISTLRWASLGAGLRMFIMSSIGFLIPLYLADVRLLNAGAIGMVMACHAAALLVTMRLGGQLADRWGSRLPVSGGMSVQAAAMALLALLPATVPLYVVLAGLLIHGAGAGLSLAALHRASMSEIGPEESGQAAGVYSMIRFGGLLLGAALGGVLLEYAQSVIPELVGAYQMVFWCVAGVAVAGVASGFLLNERRALSRLP